MARYRKESKADFYFVLLIISGLIVAAYFLGRIQADHDSSKAFCKSRYGDLSRYQECMQNKPWETK